MDMCLRTFNRTHIRPPPRNLATDRDVVFHFAATNSAAADAAKKELLEKFKTRPAPDSPEMLAKQAERARIAAEREQRAAEREKAKREKAERQKREEAERLAAAELAANADRLAKEEADKARIEQVMQYEAERKAARDARYAARKARK